jgi:hypothetical protein
VTPRQHYEALIGRLTKYCVTQVCGRRAPSTREEMAEINRRFTRLVEQAEMFHINPDLHEKQAWFLRLKARKLVACTGNKWGKTYAMLLKALVATFGCAPWDPDHTDEFSVVDREPPIDVTLCGPDYGTWIPLNILPRLKKLVPFDALAESVTRIHGPIIDTITWFNGSTWKILSYVQDTVRFEGWSTHLCLWDEPMPMEKYVAAARGCIEFSAPHVMAYTPLSNPWVFDEFYDRGFKVKTQADYELAKAGIDKRLFDRRTGMELPLVITGSMRDNPHVPAAAKKEFEEEVLRRKPWERDARIFGMHTSLMGLVYPNWQEDRHVKELETLVPSA